MRDRDNPLIGLPIGLRDKSFAGLAAWVPGLRPWSQPLEELIQESMAKYGIQPCYIMRCKIAMSPDSNYFIYYGETIYPWVTGLQPKSVRS